ncbi:MAG TPA: glyoxalase, partial [Exiguobacterium sp.]|nr:glyoxalase [Exiguobacterium sp.]
MSIHPQIILGPVRLRVTDLDRSVSFYTASLGLRILTQTDQLTVLGAQGTPLVKLEVHPNARRLPPNPVTD